MEYCIEKASEKDLDEIENLYISVCRRLQRGINYANWSEGEYPTRNIADDGIKKDSLFVLRVNHKIVGTMILNNEYESGYMQGKWSVDVLDNEILVIHTLAVHPDFKKHGIASKMLDYVIAYGKELGYKTIRIDVCVKNMPAISLYQKYGFKNVGKVDFDRGKDEILWFYLYEYLI